MRLPEGKARILDLFTSAKVQEINEAAIEMEWNGFQIDTAFFNSQAEVARRDLNSIYDSLGGLLQSAGVVPEDPDTVWSSPKQLVNVLHSPSGKGGLGLPPSPYWFKGRVKLDAGERKTDRTALEWILSQVEQGARSCAGAHPSARGVLEGLMGLRRVGSSLKYLEKLPRFVGPDGFVHPVCGPAGDEDDRVGAITGRFGMKNPESQQIPRDKRKDAYHIRRGFVAPPGQLLVVRDYTALEVVILANICEWLFGDTVLLELTAPGQDIHAYNAYNVFGRVLGWVTPTGRRLSEVSDLAAFKEDPELAWYRDAIKAVWYKLQYGGTVHGFATSLKDQKGEPVGKQRAEEILGALYEAVPSVPKWQDFVARVLERDGGISAFDGRFVDYSDLMERGDWGKSSADRKGQNFPMQSGGAHVIGAAMVEAVKSSELKKLGAVLELQVHDELRWRCPAENAQRVYDVAGEIMGAAFPLKNLRTEGGIGQNWEACK